MKPTIFARNGGAPIASKKIAVIGSGASGLGAAWVLSQIHNVTLFEADDRVGGHCHTIPVQSPNGPIPVDTGFIVYNELNYPSLCAMFDHLKVQTEASDMSFSVSVDNGRVEYSGSGLRGLFAQPANLARLSHWRMIADIVRFYKRAETLLGESEIGTLSLGALLAREGVSRAFRERHLFPMAAAIWSMPVKDIEDFPAASFLQFFDNHGLFRLADRPQWRTVSGGSQAYVRRLLDDFKGRVCAGTPIHAIERVDCGVFVHTAQARPEYFDEVVIATHADQALRLLARPTQQEQTVLGAFRYEPNRVILHSDPSLMPRRRNVWSSWNYLSGPTGLPQTRLSVTYWMNRLQNLTPEQPLFVSLNPLSEPDPASIVSDHMCDHPVYDIAAINAQKRLDSLQGVGGIWYCGSYFGYGFHEDAFASGLTVARALGALAPWEGANTPTGIIAAPAAA